MGWLGFLVGIAAKKFYELFRGKECRTKGVAILLATVAAVLLAEFVTLAISLMVLAGEEGARLGIGEAMNWVVVIMAEDPETLSLVLKDALLSLVFAALGIWSTLRDIFSQNNRKNWSVQKL